MTRNPVMTACRVLGASVFGAFCVCLMFVLVDEKGWSIVLVVLAQCAVGTELLWVTNHRPRLRRFAKWAGLSMCLLLASAFALTEGKWGPAYRFASGIHFGVGNATLAVFNELPPLFPFQGWVSCFVNPNGDIVVSSSSLATIRSGVPIPLYDGRGRSVRFRTLFFLAALPAAILWYPQVRHASGHCRKCGYNLTGNVSGVCPECGTKIESA